MERNSLSARLKAYLAQLPPSAQAMLMRGFERALANGEDAAVASLVLDQLRAIARDSVINTAPRFNDPARQLFTAIEPFLVNTGGNTTLVRPGQIRRSSLSRIWTWFSHDALPAETQAYVAALSAAEEAGDGEAADRAIRDFQRKAAQVIAAGAPVDGGAFDPARAVAKVGPPELTDDLNAVGAVFGHRDEIDAFVLRLPATIRDLDEAQVENLLAVLQVPPLVNPLVLPMVLVLLGKRLASHWQLIRLAIAHAHSDDSQRIASSPFRIAVTMALDNVVGTVGELMDDLKRGKLHDVSNRLKIVHDAVRGLRTEIDVRAESPWGRQLSAIRTTISNSLKSEIEAVPGRVRRILRQRPDKEIAPSARVDASEVEEISALIDFVGVCRNYASELAINELTLRAYSDLQHYLENSTKALIDSLRVCETRVLGFRRAQVDAGIKLCAVLYGEEYAQVMTKAADVALNTERKPSKSAKPAKTG
jgi:hypothetical protein